MVELNTSLKYSLYIFYILLPTFLLESNAKSLGTSNDGQFPGLYSLNDQIEIFTVDNFKAKLYGKQHGWLIEFYSSWCGHCQKFAPYWKELASDIRNWTSIVKIGAIDCAQEINTPVCREFEVMGYPTVRYFSELLPQDSKNMGEPIKAVGDLALIKVSLIDKLIKEQSDGRGKNWPKLTPYTQPSVVDLWKHLDPSIKYIFVIVEANDSYLGPEVILGLNHLKEVSVQTVKADNLALITNLASTQLPSLSVVTRDFQAIPITPRDKNRDAFINGIRLFCESQKLTWPTHNITEFNNDLRRPQKNDAFKNIRENLEEMGDVIFQVDLENTLHYSLKHEISVMKTIDGDKLQALKNYLSVLAKYFPFQNNGMLFLNSLRNKIAEFKTGISGELVAKYVSELEEANHPIYSHPLQWLGCRGSSATRRGYPCGLWTMFHYLSVRAVEQNGNSETFSSQEVLGAMFGYIKHFFGCHYCSQHFQQMAAERNMLGVATPDESILWLWESHNVVNKRLSGDATEDPQHPKIQFPRKDRCEVCRAADGSWNTSEVLKYLKAVYSGTNIHQQGPQPYDTLLNENSVTNAASRSQWSFMNSLDWWTRPSQGH